MSSQRQAQEFLSIASQFQLGHLVTESAHPLTKNLSTMVQQDLPLALRALQAVDSEALIRFLPSFSQLAVLEEQIERVLANGHKIFMSGCGATGRLSLVLETLTRRLKIAPNRIVGFMAGGDYALIKSVESFEDQTGYGRRQLLELGFEDGDLLIAITEGGETPFVIGTCLQAANTSEKPWFIYCNPDELLMPLERCQQVLSHKHIQKLNLTIGPMALTGSTRMQATTVQMLAVGLGLMNDAENPELIQNWERSLAHSDYALLAPFTRWEAQTYLDGGRVTYQTDEELGMAILTDTTERSPTFSLPPFESSHALEQEWALSYLAIRGTKSAEEAWLKLLGRKPRTLDWPEFNGRINHHELMGFDISSRNIDRRMAQKAQLVEVTRRDHEIHIIWPCGEVVIPLASAHPLLVQLQVKMLLNAHSTAVMGILGRYQNNVMTWVKPSNNKLIDRAARYVRLLAQQSGQEVSYKAAVEALFANMSAIEQNRPVVIEALKALGITSSR